MYPNILQYTQCTNISQCIRWCTLVFWHWLKYVAIYWCTHCIQAHGGEYTLKKEMSYTKHALFIQARSWAKPTVVLFARLLHVW